VLLNKELDRAISTVGVLLNKELDRAISTVGVLLLTTLYHELRQSHISPWNSFTLTEATLSYYIAEPDGDPFSYDIYWLWGFEYIPRAWLPV